MTAQCTICPRYCRIAPGDYGFCRARKNISGKIISLNYGLMTSIALDPIEKKPLYEYYPGSQILSLGSFGCNLSCQHCQNHEISQVDPEKIATQKLSVNDLIYLVREKGYEQVAFTYNEPLVGYEYVLDASKQLIKSGIRIILVSNGYINPQPLTELLPYTDAWSLDIKWAWDKTAQKLSGAPKAQPVFDTATAIFAAKKHLEIVTNIVPGYNDSPEELQKIAEFIAELSPDIPWHLSRAFPHYKYHGKPTPLETLNLAKTIGQKAGLKKIYLSNITNI